MENSTIQHAPFEIWRHAGVTFLAARTPDGYVICDSVGRYYGAWQDFKTFRKRQRQGTGDTSPLNLKAVVSVRGVA